MALMKIFPLVIIAEFGKIILSWPINFYMTIKIVLHIKPRLYIPEGTQMFCKGVKNRGRKVVGGVEFLQNIFDPEGNNIET